MLASKAFRDDKFDAAKIVTSAPVILGEQFSMKCGKFQFFEFAMLVDIWIVSTYVFSYELKAHRYSTQ